MTTYCSWACDCRADFTSPRGNYPVCSDHYEFEKELINIKENA